MKMENAKGTVMTGLKACEYILKHRGGKYKIKDLIKIIFKKNKI
jgi:hypothetical protein